MTKEEFISKLNQEIADLDSKIDDLSSTISYYEAVSISSPIIFESKKEIDAIKEKIVILQRLINLVSYERIKAMSDIEIDEYKKEKAELIGFKIDELLLKIEKLNQEKIDILLLERENIKKFKESTNKEEYVAKGIELSQKSEKTAYEIDRLNKEIMNLANEQAIITNKPNEAIKKEMLSKFNIVEMETFSSPSEDQSLELLAAVADDPEKTEKMARLLTQLRDIIHAHPETKNKEAMLPFFIEDARVHIIGYDTMEKVITNPKAVLKELETFEKSLKERETFVNDNYTEERMLKLVNYRENINFYKIDFDFFKLHEDKIDKNNIEMIKVLIKEREALEKKIFKTKAVRKEIEVINEKIEHILVDCYKDIVSWYEMETGRGISFSSEENVKLSIRLEKEKIERNKTQLQDFKAKAIEMDEEIEANKQKHKDAIEAKRQQIRELAGPNFTNDNVPFPSESFLDNVERIENASKIIEREGMVEEAKKIVQEDADKTEAKLRNVTLEELIEMRRKANAAKAAQEETEILDDNNPSGPKM